MKISKEELLHIAKLSDLKIEDEKIENYLSNLEDILNFANIVNKADTSELEETIGTNESYNVFRKDEVKIFKNHDLLMKNAPEAEREMFKIPKVIN